MVVILKGKKNYELIPKHKVPEATNNFTNVLSTRPDVDFKLNAFNVY